MLQPQTGLIKTVICSKYRYVGYSIHMWGNENRISLELGRVESTFLRPEDLEQIAHDLREKEKELEREAEKEKLPEIGEKVTFCGQFSSFVDKEEPLSMFQDGDILECIAIKKDAHGDDMAVFWNINKNLASGLVKEIGGEINYRRW